MMVYPSMSYWDVYKLPVPFRKWMIRRFNKHQAQMNKESGQQDMNEPLSKSERAKMIAQAKQSNPASMSEFMGQRRNH